MDCLWPIFFIKNHVNFYVLYPDQNPFIPGLIKKNLHEPSSSLALKSHELVTQEDADVVIEFDDESDSELEIELEIDSIT